MPVKYTKLVVEQIVHIPKEWEFKTKKVLISWDAERQALLIRPYKRRTPFGLPGHPRVISSYWENSVFPLTLKERLEITCYNKSKKK